MKLFSSGWGLLACVFAGTCGGCSILVDTDETPHGGQLVWSVPARELGANGEDGWSGNPVIADGVAFVVVDSIVAALDARSGAVRWRAAPYGPRSLSAARLSVRDDRLYVAADGRAAALDSRTGVVRWKLERPGVMGYCIPFVSRDGATVYLGTSAQRMLALDAATGAQRWEFSLGADSTYWSRVNAVVGSGDTIYVVIERTLDFAAIRRALLIIALDERSHRELWRYQAPTEHSAVATAPAVTDRLLVASDWYGGSFFAVDRFTGVEVWRTGSGPEAVGPDPSPVVIGDTVFGGAGDQHVYALDLATGRIRWRARASGSALNFAVCGERLLMSSGIVSAVDRGSRRVVARYFDPEDPNVRGPATSAFGVDGDRAVVAGSRVVVALPCR